MPIHESECSCFLAHNCMLCVLDCQLIKWLANDFSLGSDNHHCVWLSEVELLNDQVSPHSLMVGCKPFNCLLLTSLASVEKLRT